MEKHPSGLVSVQRLLCCCASFLSYTYWELTDLEQ